MKIVLFSVMMVCAIGLKAQTALHAGLGSYFMTDNMIC